MRIEKNFLVITDYNFINNIEESWIPKYTDRYLLYDKFGRFSESDKIRRQPNVGANMYDMFHFILTNYNNLPECTIFCKSNFMSRDPSVGGHHCSEDKFQQIVNNEIFTPIEEYVNRVPYYTENAYSFLDENNGYMENSNEVDYTMSIHRPKYFNNFKSFLDNIFLDFTPSKYIRFSPGGNYIIPRDLMLKYNIRFYEDMCLYTGWDQKPGESYLSERSIHYIFNSNLTINDKYKNV